jgi:RNA polymerase sigma-70 factor (ECF subfamily)
MARARDDPDAFAEFYEAYAQRVLVFLTRRVLDVEAAFDMTSETFAQALRLRESFRGETAAEEQAWLFQIARTQLSRYWRRGIVERDATARLDVGRPELTIEELERVETLAGLGQLSAEIRDALEHLPADQRRAIELRVVLELDYAEVARELDISEDVARARVSRGLRALGRRLAHLRQLVEQAV